MRKEQIDELVKRLPEHPFEVEMVDGQRYVFRSKEQLWLTRSAIVTNNENQDAVFLNLTLILKIRQWQAQEPGGGDGATPVPPA